jgi:CYTH domain-containing protein
MPLEIEKKYLIKKELWKNEKPFKSILIRQAYLLTDPQKTIRVRVTDTEGFLTIKGATAGISRQEYEYEIPVTDAQKLIDNFTTSLVEKIRHYINYDNKLWEVDEFKGDNEGLFVAEIELNSEDEKYELPSWIGEEVTSDRRYSNSNLIMSPYKSWNK